MIAIPSLATETEVYNRCRAFCETREDSHEAAEELLWWSIEHNVDLEVITATVAKIKRRERYRKAIFWCVAGFLIGRFSLRLLQSLFL